MFEEQGNIINSGSGNNQDDNLSPEKSVKPRWAIFVTLGLVGVIFLGILFIVFRLFVFKNLESPSADNNNLLTVKEATSSFPILPIPGPSINESSSSSSLNFFDIAIEYSSFEKFYKKPGEDIFTVNFQDYSLPLNVKMDVVNYYDLSRKLNLDPVTSFLNDHGFALIDNPWTKEAPDFYSVYASLESKQVPILITADFITYHYQNILKKTYKDIEENVFYNNLWAINKELYLAAKSRYESRLASVGNINDAVLEGARLQMAFFAVSLELLKPSVDQVSSPAIADPEKFSLSEADKFYFTPPVYLRDQVYKEVELIRAGKESVKSPNLLYLRDYKEFMVPDEYQRSARLNNLYLTMRWLNSVFPLNYKDKNCPTCLLDREDWRLTTIAASFISEDFSRSVELKNRWARIYKLMTFFKPTRDDLSYVFYRDTFRSVFGSELTPDKVFDDRNQESSDNLEKFRLALDKIEFSAFLGGIDKSDPLLRPVRGFKLLSSEYSPSEYIFRNLTYPAIGNYQGEDRRASQDMTSCGITSSNRRCNGIMLDFINLVYEIDGHDYFTSNSNYAGYKEKAEEMRLKLDNEVAWRTNNYWSSLYYLGKYLNFNNDKKPLFMRSSIWENRALNMAAASWVNTQLPLEKLTSNKTIKKEGFNSLSSFADYSYVEPNLELVSELLANVSMMENMLIALQIDKENPPTLIPIRELTDDLNFLKSIVIKELSGQTLSEDDNSRLVDFSKKMMIEKFEPSYRQMKFKSLDSRNNLKEDISRLKLLVLIRQESDGKIISVGPVWDYQESR